MLPINRPLAAFRRLFRRAVISAYFLLASAMFVHGDESAAPLALAPYGTPKIDGQIDQLWSQAPKIDVNRSVRDLPASAASDLATATARLLWDQHQLYALMEVSDSQLHGSSPDPWQQDSVELFVDENLARATSYQPDDSHYRINYAGVVTGGTNFDAAGFRSTVRRTATGYLVECAIPWLTLKPQANTAIGCELQVNDNRDGRSRGGITKWAYADNESWRNTNRFGQVRLVSTADQEGLPEPSTAAVATGTETATSAPQVEADPIPIEARMPDWAADAVFYQIFPERFRNGDPGNDPTRASLEFPETIPSNWQITPWTSDWYARAAWESELGDDFYEPAVFHRRYGGDLQGVLDQMDYLQRLGVNVLYFNPVFYARSLHKYDGNSFHHVDPYFGPDPTGDFQLMATETSDPKTWHWTSADKLFLDVIAAAHQRHIRVIIDGVFNHTGRDFFAFADLRRKQQASPYVAWYVVEDFDDPQTTTSEFKYQCWWGVDTLPEFADNEDGSNLHAGPRKYIFDSTRRWMDPDGDGNPHDGIDGWRLDVANEVPDGFWVDWNRLVRELNPQAYTVAEIWEGAADYLRRCGFSASMNYHGFAFVGKGFLLDGKAGPTSFVSDAQRRRQEHPWRIQLGMQNLFDSHDTDRIASMIVNRPTGRSYVKSERYDYDIGERSSPRGWDQYLVRKPNADERRIQKLATLFQMAYVGAPMIYYGTEAGMWGGDDPCDRKPMIWADLTYAAEVADPRNRERQPDDVAFEDDLFEFYRSVISMRKESAALRRGEVLAMTPFETANCLALLRNFGSQWALIVVNRSDDSQQLRLPAVDYMAPPKLARLLTTDPDQPAVAVSQPQHVDVTLPRLSAACWTWTVE